MGPEFLISIIVRARNEVDRVMGQVARSVDKATDAIDRQSKAQSKSAKSGDDMAKSAAALQRSYAAFTKEVADGNRDLDIARKQLQLFSREFDALARKSPVGSRQQADLIKAAQATRGVMDQITAAEKERQRQVDASYKQAAQVEQAYQQLDRERVQREQEATRNRERLVMELLDHARSADEQRVNITDDARQREVAAEQDAIERRKKLVSDLVDHVRTEDQRRERVARQLSDFEVREAARVESLRASSRADRDRLGIRQIGEDAEAADGKVRRFLNAIQQVSLVDPSRMERMREAIEDVDRGLGRGSYSAIRFAGTLRSLVYVGVFVFFQELVGAAIALAGALATVAASAVQAGVALAGMATSAAAQALPVLGLLGAAWGRVGAVFKAVEQAQKNQAQAAYDQAQAADRQRAAADAVTSAQESLTSAHERATEAQRALNEAQADGVRQIEDLIDARRRAELQLERAALRERGAREARATALRTGDVGSLAERALDVRDAAAGYDESRTGFFRARADAAAAVAGGVAGLESVRAAARAVEQARRGVDDADRALARARENAGQAVQQIATGQRMLDQMLAQLSPAERRLYDAVSRLVERYQSVFVGGPGREGILGSIIDSFTFGVGRLERLLHDPGILRAARQLSDSIAAELRHAFSFATDRENVSFIEEMGKEARENLPTVESIFEHLASLLRQVARAGAGPLRDFLKFIDQLAGDADKATAGDGGVSRLQRFFERGEQYAESFIKLGIAVGQLILALTGAGAQQGQGVLDAITAKIQEAAAYIDDHREEVQQFFSDAIKASAEIVHAAGELTKALFGLFHEERIRAFADAFEKAMLPALVTVATAVGFLSQVFLEFAGTQAGSVLFQVLITVGLLSKVFGALGGFLLRFGRDIAQFLGRERLVGLFNTLLKLLGPVRLALAFAVTAITVLNGDLPKTHTILKVVAGLLATMLLNIYGARGLVAGLRLVASGLERLAASSLLAKLGPLGRFFSSMLSNISGIVRRLPGVKAPATAAGGAAGTVVVGGRRVPETGGRPGVILPPGTRSVPIEAEARGVGAAAGGAGTAAAVSASRTAASRLLPVATVVVATLDYMTANGSVLQKLQKVASDFTFGIIPAPNVPTKQQPFGEEVSARLKSSGVGGAYFLGADTRDIDRLVGEKNLSGLREMAKQMQAIADAERGIGEETKAKNFEKLGDMADQAADKLQPLAGRLKSIGDVKSIIDPNAVAQFLSNLGRMRSGTLESMADIRKNIQFNIDRINDGFVQGSADWRQALSKNYEAGADAIEKAMHRGLISTKKGLAEIRKLVRQELELYGLDPEQARNIAKGGQHGARYGDPDANLGREGGAFRAVGGFVGNAGERGSDLVRTFLGRGEAVLNYAHQRVVDPAMRAMYGFGLDGLFKRTRGEHAGGGMGGYATGKAPDIFDGHPGNVGAAVRGLVKLMKGRFPLVVTSTTDHSRLTTSGNVSDHSVGNAVDLAGDSGVMLRAAEWVKSSGLYKRLKQGIHNPNLAVNLGRIQDPPGQFAGAVWAQHANHIHLAIVEALGKISGGAAAGVKRVLAKGVDGPLGAIAQGALDSVRRAANRQIRLVANSLGTSEVGEDDVGESFKGSWVAEMGRIASRRHWSLDDWRWIVGHESGGRVSIKNPTSTAFGLGQLLDSTYAKYGGGPGSTGVEQIRAMASYIADRYLNPTRAKAFWQAHNWYARGGEVSGKLGQAVPIVAHAGEWVVNRLQQSKLASLSGHSVGALKGMLGFTGGRGSYAGGGDVQPYSAPGFIGSAPGDVTREISRADAIIARLRTSVINAKFTDALSQTFASLLGDGGLFDQLNDAIQAYTDKLSTNLARAAYKVDQQGRVVQRRTGVQLADMAVDNLEKIRARLQRQQQLILTELAEVASRLDDPTISKGERNYLRSVQKNLTDRLDDVRQAVADNLSSSFQAIEDAVQARLDATQKDYDRWNFGLSALERTRTLVGSTANALGLPSPDQIGQARAAGLMAQAAQVQQAAQYALSQGHTDTYQTLVQTIEDLQLQAAEAVKAGLEATAQDINDEASRREARVGLANRMADLLQAGGNVAGSFALRASSLATQGQSLVTQRDQLSALLGSALSQGQTGVADDLVAQIEELNVQIAENSQAVKENTVAARSAAIDAITQRGGFLSGVYGGLGGIVTALGQITGAVDTTAQRSLLSLQGRNLATTGSGLAQQLLAYGVDVRGLTPSQIVSKLAGTDFGAIESALIPSDRAVFESLINSIIENTSATVDNNNSLAQLDGSLSQTFSSTAWQRFRTAIFNGAGGLLPQYQFAVPSAAVGAIVTRGGLINVHSGEVIPAAKVESYEGGDGSSEYIENFNVNVTHPVEKFDYADASRQIAFARKHQPR